MTFKAVPIAAILLAGASASAQAYQFVVNGGFEETTSGPGQVNFNTALTGWSVAGSPGYTFIFAPGTADTSGSNGQYGNLSLWGPGNGSANGLPATSPDGGNFIAQDPVFQTGALQQTLTKLGVGDTYTVTFWWAGAQQYGFTGPTTEGWQVSLGGETKSTGILNNDSHGFTGWTFESLTFTADSSSEGLSFAALGGPPGVPPFALLDGVSVTGPATPEASTWAMIMLGFAGLGLAGYRRSKRSLAPFAA